MLARGWAAAAALGPHGYGLWNTLNLVFDYGSYASIGAIQGLDLELPAASRNPARAQSLMRGAWSVVAVGAMAFSIAVVVMLALRPTAIELPAPGLVGLMLLAALLQLAFQYHAAALRAMGRVPSVSAAQAVQAVVGAGLGLALVWSTGLWGLLYGWLAGTLLALALMRRDGREISIVPGFWSEGVALAKIGFPVFGFYVASLVLRSVDRLALVRFGTPESLGLYSLGLMVTGSLLHLPESAAFVLFPRVAAAHRSGENLEDVKLLVKRTQRVIVAFMPIVVGLVMIWTGPVVEWLLPEYIGGIRAIQMLCIAALVLATSTVPSYYLLGAGDQKKVLLLGVLAALAAGAIVFRAASLDPTPLAIATAATMGYGVFVLPALILASLRLCHGIAERVGFVALSLLPPAALSGLALVLLHVAPGHGVMRSLTGTLIFLIISVPVAFLIALKSTRRRIPSGPV
jgi:O-antigen/teichoic acid export membrane protein